MFKKGIFTISIDVELTWGTFDHAGYIKYKTAYEKYRAIIKSLLRLFKKYEIAATWAIVGHLFLDSCKKENGILHPDIVRPTHNWFPDDWFSCDPASDLSRNNFWYGSDIVDMIKRALPKHEIASHSFCHPVFSDEECSKQTAESDIKKCVELAEKEGIDLKSFAFPRNTPGHLDMLSKYGFIAFRGNGDVYCKIKPKILKKICLLLNDIIGSTPPVVLPNITDFGLVEIPSSMLFRFAYGKSKFIPKGIRLKKAKKGIDRAIREGKIFHLWFHPISFAWKTAEMLEEFEEILEDALKKRNKGILEILTLEKIAELSLKQKRNHHDKFDPESIVLHDKRSQNFKTDYADSLSNYYSNAFKYGRKKIETALFRFLNTLTNGSRLLDVGCGCGYYLNLIQRQGFNCSGIDLSKNMIQELKSNYPDLNVQMADARNIPFENNSFDAVISIETLRYFSERRPILKEIYRVTKPAGSIFITAAPLLSGNTYGFFNILCRVLHLKSFVSCFQSFETVRSLRKRLEQAGFRDISIQGYFFGPYFLLDKISSKASLFLMKKFEGLDNRIERNNLMSNFSNHLVAVAKKPKP